MYDATQRACARYVDADPACSTYPPWDLGAKVTVVVPYVFAALYGTDVILPLPLFGEWCLLAFAYF